MIYITIYGIGTSEHQLIKQRVQDVLTRWRTPFIIHDETSIQSFLSKELGAVPAVEVNGTMLEKNGEKSTIEYVDRIVNYISQTFKPNTNAIHHSTN